MVETINTAVYKVRLDVSSLQGDLKKADKLIENSLDNASESIGSEFKNAMGNVDKTFDKSLSKITSATKQKSDFVIGLIVSAADRAFNYVANTISNSLSSAISRVDTLNNFPRVMESLGYSADEAASSIETISNSLDGLPTSLDGMASNVQKLAATMGNLNTGTINATSVGLAFNNMMLAGGKGTEAATNAFEQYNQMLAVGKVDQQAWNSVVNAAPGQMKQLAETLLGAGSNAQELYDAMKDGVVTFDDFNAAVVSLNTKGGDSFESFEEQARSATGGIGTALENVQNRVNKAVSSVIDAIGQSNISDAINSFSSQFGKLGNAIAAAFTGEGEPQVLVQEFVNGIGDALTTMLPQLGDIIGKIAPILLSAIVGLLPSLLDGLVQGAASLISALAEALPSMLDSIIDAVIGLFDILTSPDTISLLLDAAIQMFMAIVDAIPQIIEALAMAIPRIIDAITRLLTSGGMIMKILNGAITVFFAIIDAIPVMIQALAEALPDIITSIINFLTSPDTIMMLIEAAVTLFLALVMAVPKILGALLDAFGSLVGALWEGIKAMFGTFANNFGEFLGSIFKGALNGVLNFIENFLNNPIKLINGFIDVINNAFGWLGVNIGAIGLISLPRMYTGGIIPAVSGGMPIIAGDGGEDEWVVPESKMASLVEQLENRGNMASGNTYNIYVEGVFATSATERRKVADQIVEAINQNDRRRFA